jgi:uncharacterized membrane protein
MRALRDSWRVPRTGDPGRSAMKRKLVAAAIGVALGVGALGSAAHADQPKFNPGQKGNVCSAPGPNNNPHCVPR